MELLGYITGTLLLWNLVVFFLYWMDKYRSRRGMWRVKERTLIVCAFLGGGIGGLLGMCVLRHKTRHLKFRILLPLAAVATVALLVYLLRIGGGAEPLALFGR